MRCQLIVIQTKLPLYHLMINERDGFKQICQVLIDIGYKYGLMKTIKSSADILIPDRTNISRTTQ
ncbi:unnamed protein product, partial [Rotaria socialis]